MAGSKTDPLLANSEPISDSGSTAGVTALRRKSEVVEQWNNLELERRVRVCERNSPEIRISEKWEEFYALKQRFLCSP